jgi:hypothetical protein
MDNAVGAQGNFPIFFGEQVIFIFLSLQANRAKNFLLFKEGNDFPDLHGCSFLAFSGSESKAGGRTLTAGK